MKHGESDVERQISIQGIHFSAFWDYFWKREKEALIIFYCHKLLHFISIYI